MKNSACFENFLKENSISYKKDRSLKNSSTFRIGGIADFCVFPAEAVELIGLLQYLSSNGEKHTVIGNGSNILFDDAGFDGAVISTAELKRAEASGEIITAYCGASMTRTALLAANNRLTGLEFAYGIPGSIGGGVYMNAGAYGSEMSAVVRSVDYFDGSDGKVKTASADECDFSYRKSIFSHRDDLIVIGATLKLSYGDESGIRTLMRENMQKRHDNQPLEYPSAGSVFKRPEGHFAGRLIEECGLKGYRIGDACVSEKHAGFIVNLGNATSKDVLDLIDYIKGTVLKKFGIELECEIKYIK